MGIHEQCFPNTALFSPQVKPWGKERITASPEQETQISGQIAAIAIATNAISFWKRTSKSLKKSRRLPI